MPEAVEISIGRFTILPLIALGLVVFSAKLRKRPTQMIANLLIGTSGMAIAAISALPNPIIWWLHILGIAGMHYSVLFFYFGIDQILNQKQTRPILKSPIFIMTTVLTLVTAILDFTRRDNLNPIIDNNSYQPTWEYFTSEFIHYFIMFCISLLIAMLYIQNIRKYRSTRLYNIRRYICTLTFIIITIVVFVVNINVFLAINFGDIYRAKLNYVYHVGKPIIFLLIIIGFVIPQRMFSWLVSPFLLVTDRYEDWQKRRNDAIAAYLHDHMVHIVPCVHLDNKHIQHLRIHSEIGDARELIWSHEYHPPCTPKAEAAHILKLLQMGAVISTPGQYNSHTPNNLIDYNLSVARHLKRLERQQKKRHL